MSYSYRSRNYPQRGSLGPVVFLLGLNFVFFIATLIRPEILYLLGLQPASLPFQPWTIVSSMFMHSGFWHLITNMWMLFFFGSYLCRLVGEGRFLTVYLCGGILGNLFFILLGPPFAIVVGASGAIFALGGALAMMRPKLRVFIFPIPVPMPLWVAVIGGFIFLTLIGWVAALSIAWEAHLGGLIAGLIAGYFLRRRERRLLFS